MMQGNVQSGNTKKPLPDKVMYLGLTLSFFGVVLYALGYWVDVREAAFNNIVNFLFLTSLGVGSLFLITLEYIAGAVWSVPMRRIIEFLAVLTVLAVVIALPLFFHLKEIFSWVHSETIKGVVPESMSSYLNVRFLIIRFAIIFGLWILFYYLLTKNSLKQDIVGDQKYTRWNVRLSGLFMPVFALGISLIAIDWAMSLEPRWSSTIFGIYYFAGTVIAALAAATYIIVQLYEHGYLPHLKRDHFYSLGALMFAFVNFWAYIAFSQFMLVWYSNLPEETFWFMMRWKNGWQIVSVLLILVQFWIPYFALLAQDAKMNLKRLKFMSLWLLVAHFVDMYWLVMPTYDQKVTLSWMVFGFPVLTIGLVIIVLARKMKMQNLVPIGDPKLKRGLEFHL
jgi:hypothetical protein